MEIIPIPHLEQSREGYCLPACARMVLAALGVEQTESAVGAILGSRDFGTPSYAVQRLASLSVAVKYQEFSVRQIESEIQQQHPVILFVRTGFLDYWTVDVAHAVVVVGITENQGFWVHDPALATGPTSVSWDGLLAASAEFGYMGATITHN